MTWLVWRRQRAALLTAGALVVVVAAVLVAGRLIAVTRLRALGIDDSCFDVATDACREAAVAAIGVDAVSGYGIFWGIGHAALLAAPLVIGLLTGTGLFQREFDEGTHVLALTQATSVTRWWATALVVAGLPTAALAGLLGVVADWAYDPFGFLTAFSPLQSPVFEISGIVPVAYALLAFSLAAGTGLVARSSLAAVVVAVVGYGAAMVVLATFARPQYLPAETARQWVDLTRADAGITDVPAAWQLQNRWIDAAGRTRTLAGCEPALPFVQCLRDAGVNAYEVRYQPDSRYWPFQLVESAVLLALATAAQTLTCPRLVARWQDRRGWR